MSIQPVQRDLEVVQGAALYEQVYWAIDQKGYVPITSITNVGNISTINATTMTIPEGWPFIVRDNVLIDSGTTYYSKGTTGTTTQLQNVYPGIFDTPPVSWGYMEYNLPFSLIGATAKCEIRTLAGALATPALTTENGGITIDTVNSNIIFSTSDTTTWIDTDNITYSLQVTLSTGQIVVICYGNVGVLTDATQ
jgi:hypothetical protein